MSVGRSLGMVLVFAALTALAAVIGWWNEKRMEGMGRAVDGDSLVLDGQRIRLVGLDAPELDQICEKDGRPWRCGQASRLALSRELARGPALCRSSKRDRYGRALAVCSVAGLDINAFLVRSGAAVAYGGYEREEAEARDARRGVWASRFDPPQEWRRAHPHPRDERAPEADGQAGPAGQGRQEAVPVPVPRPRP